MNFIINKLLDIQVISTGLTMTTAVYSFKLSFYLLVAGHVLYLRPGSVNKV